MSELKRLDHKNLALGEVTNHAHRATSDDAVLYGREDGSVAVMDLPTGGDVVHEEHATVSLPAGEFDVSIVVEQNHVEDEARQVMD